jgi:hypothetical protein
MKLTELKDVKVIAFVNNTPDGPDYKRAVITTVGEVHKIKGGSPLLYDPDRFNARTWISSERYYKVWNIHSKKKLGKVPNIKIEEREKYTEKLWSLIEPIAVKPAEKDMTGVVVETPEKEPKVKKKAPVKTNSVVNENSIIQATGKQAKSEKNAARHKLYKKVKVKTILSKNGLKLADIKYDIKSGYAEVVG